MTLPRCKDSRPTPLTGASKRFSSCSRSRAESHVGLSAPVTVFGWFQLPPICPENRVFPEQVFFVHSLIDIALDCLAAAPIGAALYHHSARKNRVLMRMITG